MVISILNDNTSKIKRSQNVKCDLMMLRTILAAQWPKSVRPLLLNKRNLMLFSQFFPSFVII